MGMQFHSITRSQVCIIASQGGRNFKGYLSYVLVWGHWSLGEAGGHVLVSLWTTLPLEILSGSMEAVRTNLGFEIETWLVKEPVKNDPSEHCKGW